MSEEEIRLDQTIKVFDMLALLIKNNETCTYRYLIYDMLGFKEENYAELMSGMAITNKLVECETQKEILDKIKEILNNMKPLSLVETSIKEELKSAYNPKESAIKGTDEYFDTVCHLEDFEIQIWNIKELLEEIE